MPQMCVQWDMKATAADIIKLAELSFNLETGEATKRDFTPPNLKAEFPKVPAHLQGAAHLRILDQPYL